MTATIVTLNQIYRCAVCGAMVEVLHGSDGTLTCCNQPMLLLQENTVEASREKHIPVIEQTAGGVIVKVGSVAHPMEEKHYIQWIELIAGNQVYRQNLQPGEAPQATFAVTGDDLTARAYCNLHGLWKG